MYTQFQRFVATLLLFSILLQSCGNPNWKMVEPVEPAASGKTSNPSKVKKRAPAKLLPMQDGSSEGSMVPTVDHSSEVANASSAEHAVEELAKASSETSHVAHRGSRLSTSTPTSTRSTVAPVSKSVQAARLLSGSKKNPRHNANKSRHVVLDEASVSQHTRRKDDQASATPLPHTLSPTRAPQPWPSTTGTAHSAHTNLKPSTDATAHQALARTVPGHLTTQPYPSAQGHQVHFQEQAGRWMAQVEDVWGRTQELPVICAPDQTPERALQQLASKAPGQHKYWVHVLETHRPPWAPRVVYLGALGLRGGVTVENPIDTTVTETHTLQKDAQQAYQIDQAHDEKKKDPKQSTAIGTQDHHGKISGNLSESSKHIVKPITIPFDNRPLAPLVHAVNTACMQLNQCALGTEQLDASIIRGNEVMQLLEQQPYTPALDLDERVLRKTIEEKLSCHVRLYQRLDCWSKSFTDTERAFFEAVIIPVFRNNFLRADTTVQQELLAYWENGGHCYTDILQDTAVEDWLSQSLYLDITQEALVNNNELLSDQFMQSVWHLVQHTQGPAQTKLLNQLLWSLRIRQQAHQFDLLTICKLMAWLPTDSEEALRLLNDNAPNWYETLKTHWIRPRLEAFKDRYQEEEMSALCDALTQLPWDVALTKDFLEAIKEEKDYQALKSFLLFLVQYPVEETLLLETFRRAPPEKENNPCKTLHHILACELLHDPLTALFGQQADALYGQITALLQSHLGAYDGLYTLLTTLQAADITQQQRNEQALQLREVFTLLSDYGVATEVCTEALKAITNQPVKQWDKTTHQLVVDATFHASHELSTQEMIDRIAQHAPGVFFAGDAQKLKDSYEAVLAAYRGHSTVLDHNDPIASWSSSAITEWANKVRSTEQHTLPTQSECIAVVKRAVELHHGFPPRTAQLLSVLTLLNTPEKTGRLAQINTGEGKSLIVAMLAALHALQGHKVDVLTTSTELSRPELDKQTPFFTALGLTAGENSKKNAASDEDRHAIYQKDIVYGTAEDFQADIISTEFFRRNIRGNRGFGVVLVDEVDSMLFDDRSYSTQLSGHMPAMNHLEIVLVWYGTR